jgi:hypothetical protein
MLVFSPRTLPDIFRSLIIDFTPSMRNTEPANALYMLARFACLTCDSSWLEDLIIGATDAIEETFFRMDVPATQISKLKLDQSRSEDFPCLVFWLCNTTVWLHLMRCDNSINEACELLGSFVLVEEVINSVFGTYPELFQSPALTFLSIPQFSLFAMWKGGPINFSMPLFWIILRYPLSLTEFSSSPNGRFCVH